MAAEAGIDLKLRVVEFATTFKQAQAGEFQIFQINWSGRIDPDGNSYVFLHTKAPQNDGGYSNRRSTRRSRTRASPPIRRSARRSMKR